MKVCMHYILRVVPLHLLLMYWIIQSSISIYFGMIVEGMLLWKLFTDSVRCMKNKWKVIFGYILLVLFKEHHRHGHGVPAEHGHGWTRSGNRGGENFIQSSDRPAWPWYSGRAWPGLDTVRPPWRRKLYPI